MTAAALTVMMVIGSVFLASPASATAGGYDYWGVHTIRDVPVPSGQLFGIIRGNGLNWSEAGGSFIAAGNLCNWHFSVVFYEGARSKNNATVLDQENQSTCSHTGAYKIRNGDGASISEGSVCIRLYRDFGNEQLGSVCHGISK